MDTTPPNLKAWSHFLRWSRHLGRRPSYNAKAWGAQPRSTPHLRSFNIIISQTGCDAAAHKYRCRRLTGDAAAHKLQVPLPTNASAAATSMDAATHKYQRRRHINGRRRAGMPAPPPHQRIPPPTNTSAAAKVLLASSAGCFHLGFEPSAPMGANMRRQLAIGFLLASRFPIQVDGGHGLVSCMIGGRSAGGVENAPLNLVYLNQKPTDQSVSGCKSKKVYNGFCCYFFPFVISVYRN